MEYFKRNDIFIIIAIVVISVGMMITLNAAGPENTGVAVVTLDGGVYREVPLSRDADYVVENEGRHNTVRVEGGEIFMLDASCPDLACVRQGKISTGSGAIVCLPNKVLIKLRGDIGSGDVGTDRLEGPGGQTDSTDILDGLDAISE